MSNPEIQQKIDRVRHHVSTMNTRVSIGGYGLSVEPIRTALLGILDILQDIEKDRNTPK